MKFKQRLRRMAVYMILGFVFLFAGRLGYGYYEYPDGWNTYDDVSGDEGYFQSQQDYGVKKNYASSKYTYKSPGEGPAAHEFDINQKYEKVANIRSTSKQFGDDEASVRSKIEEYNAIIQAEDNSGNEGRRSLFLVVGVQPDKFDAFCTEIKKIGKITSINVSKVDKTNDFLTLKATRASLESTRQALLELKKQPGSVDEMLNLQDKIQSVEEELQGLGVQLGEFDELNSFCTVNISLIESRTVTVEGISLTHRLSVAFWWATEVYLAFMGLIIFTSFAALIVLIVIDKLGILRKLVERLDNECDKH